MAHTKVTKTGTQNTGTANTFSYSGSFNVFKASEVEVELDNVKLTFTTSTIDESASPREYTVDYSAKTIHIGGGNLAGTNTVVIQPVTDMGAPTPRATYEPGSSVTSADLNNNQLQLMRKAMEYDEQKLSSRGGTMTGNLHLAKDIDITFEGDTDNAHEITLTVAEPTSDKTITLPDTTGTVVTTGDTGTVTATMLAANSVDSSELVDGSIDSSHISTDAVITDKIAADAVTGAKIADNAINSEHYTDGSIDHVHLANDIIDGDNIQDNAINSEHYVDGSIDHVHLANDVIDGDNIQDDVINSEHIAAGAVDFEHMSANSVDSDQYVDGSIDHVHLSNDCIDGDNIQDDSINSEHYVADSIDTEHYAPTSIDDAALASNAVTESKITDSSVTTNKIANDAITIGKIGCEQTTISNSDSHIPTSGAVVDYVAAQIAPIGGLEVIADEDNFPTSQPASGVVISISDAAGIVVNGSGVSTTARTAGNGSDNVTINNFPSSLYGETLASGVGLMVSSTGSSHTYNYHKILAAETDVKQLSDDINDFNARYRVDTNAPSSSLNEGDLWWDKATDKLKVYSGASSSWEEVASAGDFYINTISSYSGTGGNSATFNGSAYRFVLSNPGSVAQQHVVSINGVIQKPNSGTSQPSEGFVIDGTSIIFSNAPATGSDYFILTLGTTVSIGTPSDGTVTAAKITSGAVTTAKIADDAVTAAKIADDAVGAEHIEQLDADLSFADNVHAKFGAGNDLQIDHSGTNSQIYHDGTGHLYIATQGSGEDLILQAKNEFKVSTADSERLRLDSSGRLLVGTTTHSNTNLTVYGDGTNDNKPAVIFQNSSTGTGGTNGFYVGGDHDTTNGYVWNYESSNVILATANLERLRLDSTGRVGIGATSFNDAAEYLLVKNDSTAVNISIVASNDAHSSLNLGDEDDFNIQKIKSDHTDNSLQFFTDNTERLRIKSNGSVFLNPTQGSTGLTSGAIKRFDAGLDYWNSTAGNANAIKYAVHGAGDDNMYGMGISASLLELQSQVDIGFFCGGAGAGTGRRVEKFRMKSTGNLEIVDGDIVIGTSGHGIDFSATGDASGGSSELFDDYEEGTFTPTIDDGMTNPTMSRAKGSYTKIGRQVFFQMHIIISGGTQSSGHLQFGGLPFTSKNDADYAYGGAWLNYQNDTFDKGEEITFHIGINEARIKCYKQNGDSLVGNDAAIDDITSEMLWCGQYIV